MILAIFILPAIAYQIYIFITYHAIIPTLNVTHPQEYLKSVYYIPEDKRKYLNIIEWIKMYWDNIQAGWFSILSHHSLVKQSIFDFIGLLVFHIIAIIALFSKCSNKYKIYCILGKILLVSLFIVSMIQCCFSYSAHLKSGYMGGLQPRYLLPFMFSFAILAALYIERFKNSFWLVIAIIILGIQALYSDFFYFLTYYM